MPRNDRRQDIEGLRGIAVLAVLLFHVGFPWVSGGFVGVDIFFVISGFVITSLVQREIDGPAQFTLGNFYTKRVKRLLPAFAATVVVTLIAGFLFFAPAHLHDLSGSAVFAAAAIPNFYFWQHSGYFDISSKFQPLLHTWSLGVEQQFYLVWPAFLLMAAKLSSRIATFGLVITVGLVSLWLNIRYESDIPTIYFLPWFRIFEFTIGAALYWLGSVRPNKVLAEASTVGGGALIATAVLMFDDNTVFPSTNALLPCLGAALMIYGGAASWSGRFILSHPWLAGIGTLSYSLYLVHWPLMVFWRYVKFEELTDLDRAAIIVLAFGLSWLMHRFIELPFYKGDAAHRLRPAAFGAVMAVIAAVAYVPWANGGWQFRAGDAALNYPELAELGEVVFRKTQYGGAAMPPKSAQGATPRSVLIAGDSHGRQYFAGIAAIYPPGTGLQVIDEGSCIFRVRRCNDFDARVASFVEQSPNGLIFISQRWDFNKHIALHLGREAVGNISAVQLAEFYAGRIAAIFDLYRLAADQRVFIMGAAPEVVSIGDVATCLLRPSYFSGRGNCDTADERDLGIAFRKSFNEALAIRIDALNKSNGWRIAFGDPFDVLCNSGTCAQVAERRILYNDHDHLSIAGSELVISAFRDELLTRR